MGAPIRTFKAGLVEVALWASQYGVNLTIQRSYKDKTTQQWKRTGSLNLSDAIVAHRLLGDAISVAIRQEAEDRKQRENPRGESRVEDDFPATPDNPPSTRGEKSDEDEQVPF